MSIWNDLKNGINHMFPGLFATKIEPKQRENMKLPKINAKYPNLGCYGTSPECKKHNEALRKLEKTDIFAYYNK